MRLGNQQQGALESLVEFGIWSTKSGWLWDTDSNTTRIMDSLTKRGLAKRDGKEYKPTEAGINHLKSKDKS